VSAFGFSEEDLVRYSRQMLLPEVGGAGQRRLLDARVAIVGAGGLGSPVALYLAAAGVGRITLVDNDEVDLSNLQRQVLHATADVGRPKVESARERLLGINPGVRVEAIHARLEPAGAEAFLAGHDVVVEGSDNFETKFAVNDAAVALGIPVVHGGVLRFTGQVFTTIPGKSACYRCVFEEPPPPGSMPTCQEAGVIGPVPGVIGCFQAAEAMKVLLGRGEPLAGRILEVDLLAGSVRTIQVRPRTGCPACARASWSRARKGALD